MEQRCNVQQNHIKYGKLLFLLPQAPLNLNGNLKVIFLYLISRLLQKDGEISYFIEGVGGKGFGNFQKKPISLKKN